MKNFFIYEKKPDREADDIGKRLFQRYPLIKPRIGIEDVRANCDALKRLLEEHQRPQTLDEDKAFIQELVRIFPALESGGDADQVLEHRVCEFVLNDENGPDNLRGAPVFVDEPIKGVASDYNRCKCSMLVSALISSLSDSRFADFDEADNLRNDRDQCKSYLHKYGVRTEAEVRKFISEPFAAIPQLRGRCFGGKTKLKILDVFSGPASASLGALEAILYYADLMDDDFPLSEVEIWLVDGNRETLDLGRAFLSAWGHFSKLKTKKHVTCRLHLCNFIWNYKQNIKDEAERFADFIEEDLDESDFDFVLLSKGVNEVIRNYFKQSVSLNEALYTFLCALLTDRCAPNGMFLLLEPATLVQNHGNSQVYNNRMMFRGLLRCCRDNEDIRMLLPRCCSLAFSSLASSECCLTDDKTSCFPSVRMITCFADNQTKPLPRDCITFALLCSKELAEFAENSLYDEIISLGIRDQLDGSGMLSCKNRVVQRLDCCGDLSAFEFMTEEKFKKISLSLE